MGILKNSKVVPLHVLMKMVILSKHMSVAVHLTTEKISTSYLRDSVNCQPLMESSSLGGQPMIIMESDRVCLGPIIKMGLVRNLIMRRVRISQILRMCLRKLRSLLMSKKNGWISILYSWILKIEENGAGQLCSFDSI